MNAFLDAALENQLLVVMAVLSFGLLVVVTGGVVYLTVIEWRDKRRRGEEARVVSGAGFGKRRKRK